MRILIKAIAAGLLMIAATVIWLVVDEPLDEETRLWLEPPPPPASPTLDAATHIKALGEAAGVSRKDVDPDDRCALLDRRCAEYVTGHRDQVLAALPQSKAYWDAYQRVLRAEGIAVDVQRPLQLPWQAYIQALEFSIMRELARYGRLRPEFMVETVDAQRRLLGEAPFLIDKMVFAATTSMSFTALELALQTTPPDDPGFGAMVRALRPLTTAEVSLRRAMGGEMRYMVSQQPEDAWFNLFFKRHHMLNLQRRVLTPIVEDSELSGTAFWQSEPPSSVHPTWWDRAFDPTGTTLVSVAAPAYSHYVEGLRILNVNAVVLREWAATLSGKPYPPAGSTPEGLSHWVWQHESAFLCLMPTADAPRFTHVEPAPVCRQAGLP